MMAETESMPFFLDDISSIESSSRRERKYSEERISEQEMIIKSLTHAVQRLADTLETKEAELKMTQRADVDLESKVWNSQSGRLTLYHLRFCRLTFWILHLCSGS